MSARLQPASSVRAVAVLAALSWLPGCGGAAVAPQHDDSTIELVAGPRVTVGHTRLTMAIPKGFDKRSDDGWSLLQGKRTAAVLRFTKHPSPERDVDSWIDSLIQSVEKGGRAGVLVNKTITLGDLEGRLIGAEDLLGKPRTAVRMVIAPAEDGVWVAAFFASANLIHKQTKVLDEALLSLRIPEVGR